eukprot:5860068-Alexandrium_andersonii.AAC.1
MPFKVCTATSDRFTVHGTAPPRTGRVPGRSMDATTASNCVTCCAARSAAVSFKRSTLITLPRATAM